MPRRSRIEDEPTVYEYLDYRHYLREWFEWKKAKNPRYSYAVFAKRAGFSRGVLNNVIAGRRAPGSDTLDGIGRAMGIGAKEIEFLALLVSSAHAGTLEERAQELRLVFDHPDFRLAQALDPTLIQLMSMWSANVLFELIRLPGFSDDPEWLAARLGGRLTTDEARRALELCLKSGAVSKNEDGTYSQDLRRVGIGLHSPHDILRLLHLDWLDLAREAITTLPQSERYALAVTAAVSRSMVPAVQERLANLMRELTDLLDHTEPAGVEDGEVYTIATYFFPNTTTPAAEPDED